VGEVGPATLNEIKSINCPTASRRPFERKGQFSELSNLIGGAAS
jgi:hypothetical protein